jgi:3-phosphoshikimate 1-carboxyvinyltransferase
VSVPGDKSIAHRCIIASALAKEKTSIENFPVNKDCLYTLEVLRKLGVRIVKNFNPLTGNTVTVFGQGIFGLKKPSSPVFVGDSGTTLRLVLGVLAGCDFKVTLVAGKSLSQRPMLRVTRPLRMMGAQIIARHKPHVAHPEEYPPLTIHGGNLKPIHYRLPVASAQVKSAIMLAALFTKQGVTEVIEPLKTRDHTERIFSLFKADIKIKHNKISIRGNKELISPKKIYVPGDISSASFFMVAATLVPDSCIIIQKVSLNPSRSGIVKVLKRMGAFLKVSLLPVQAAGEEPVADIMVKSRMLKATTVTQDEVPSLIDELPILMVAACFAQGKSVFQSVRELRVKETDRIVSMTQNLKKMGAHITIQKQGLAENIVIEGQRGLRGAKVKSFGDHRTAMSMVVAGLRAEGQTIVDDVACMNKSFPDFLVRLKQMMP